MPAWDFLPQKAERREQVKEVEAEIRNKRDFFKSDMRVGN